MQLTNMKQTAELIGVTYSALQSAIFHNKIPEPKLKIGSHKSFDAEEVGVARRSLRKTVSGGQPGGGHEDAVRKVPGTPLPRDTPITCGRRWRPSTCRGI